MSEQMSKSTSQPVRERATGPMTCTWNGFWRGVRLCSVLLPGAIAFALSFGALASAKGLTLVETGAMSLFVFAGASQVAAIELWTSPVPWLTMVVTTAIINSRMILASASLYPWAEGLRGWRKFLLFFLLADGNWALGMSEHSKGERDIAIVIGGGAMFFAMWAPTSMLGHYLGSFITDPGAFALDMLVPLFFLAMLVPLWKGGGILRNPNLLPWAASALVSSVLFMTTDSQWYLLVGALVGAAIAAIQPVRPEYRDDD